MTVGLQHPTHTVWTSPVLQYAPHPSPYANSGCYGNTLSPADPGVDPGQVSCRCRSRGEQLQRCNSRRRVEDRTILLGWIQWDLVSQAHLTSAVEDILFCRPNPSSSCLERSWTYPASLFWSSTWICPWSTPHEFPLTPTLQPPPPPTEPALYLLWTILMSAQPTHTTSPALRFPSPPPGHTHTHTYTHTHTHTHTHTTCIDP